MRLITPTILDHWHCRFDDLQHSSKEFYDALEIALRKSAFPRVRSERIRKPEGGTFSRNREYLRITRGQYDFIVCAAPFGRGYFVSWWLKQRPGIEVLLKLVPLVGGWLYRSELRQTYYQMDTEVMFKESVKSLVDAAVKALDQGKGYREQALGEMLSL